MATQQTITDADIRTLIPWAIQHDDDVLYVTCDIALGSGPDGDDIDPWESRYGGGGLRVSRRERVRLLALTQDEAREIVAREIQEMRSV